MKRGKLQSLMGPKDAAMIHATIRPIDVNGEQICNTSCSTNTANSNWSLLLFYTASMRMFCLIQFVSEL